MGVPPLHVLLLDSSWWGWRWRSLREQFSRPSVGWKCRGLGGWRWVLAGSAGGGLATHGSGDGGLWHHHDLLLWVLLLHLDWGCQPLDSRLPHCWVLPQPLGYLYFSRPGQWKTQSMRTSSWLWEHLLPWEDGSSWSLVSFPEAWYSHAWQLSTWCSSMSCVILVTGRGSSLGDKHILPPVHLFSNV